MGSSRGAGVWAGAMPVGLCWTEGLCAASGPGLWLPCLPLQCWGPREQGGDGPDGAGHTGCPGAVHMGLALGPGPHGLRSPAQGVSAAALWPREGKPHPAGKHLLAAMAALRRKGSKSQETQTWGLSATKAQLQSPLPNQVTPSFILDGLLQQVSAEPARGFPGDVDVVMRSVTPLRAQEGS